MIKKILKTPRYWLTLADCKKLLIDFNELLSRNEPIPPFEERFPNKLEGILESVNQTFDSKYLNQTVLESGAAYFNQFVRGHAFKNGNKRSAVLFTHFFLLANGVNLTLTPEELYNFAVLIAKAGENNVKPETTKKWCIKILEEFTEDLKENN